MLSVFSDSSLILISRVCHTMIQLNYNLYYTLLNKVDGEQTYIYFSQTIRFIKVIIIDILI